MGYCRRSEVIDEIGVIDIKKNYPFGLKAHTCLTSSDPSSLLPCEENRFPCLKVAVNTNFIDTD
jgi:hypothetical protein